MATRQRLIDEHAEAFYKEFLAVLVESKQDFLIGGTFAVKYYTGIKRPTKDIDVFCKASDYPKILKEFQERGYKIKILDERWLAKVYQGKRYADVIFGSIPGLWPITDDWFNRSRQSSIFGLKVNITPPEELIVSKIFRQGRDQYEGSDVAHMFLKQGQTLEWKLLLNLIEPHWEVLLAQLIMFRFIYPSERNTVPEWVMKEFINRLQLQLDLPAPLEKIGKGSILSHRDYQIAYTDWGFKDLTDFFYKENPFDQEPIH